MGERDLPRVKALSDRIHPDLVERIEVFADRLAIFPSGSLVLSEDEAVLGYAVSHPGKLYAPPPLDHVFGVLPAPIDAYYLHDVVVEPNLRGRGFAQVGVRELLVRQASAFPVTTLISVYGTKAFWMRFGFEDRTDGLPAETLARYGDGARYMLRQNR